MVRSSKTKTAAPSPWTMPLRFAENGRQPSRDITRSPSQALIPPKHSMLSLPPVSTTSAWPVRISPNACPIAWFDEAQAVDTVKLGPWMLWIIDRWLAAALFISRGTMKG